MENQHHQKVVTVSYLVFAALIYFLIFTGMNTLSNLYDMESKIKSIEFIVRGASLLIGFGVFFGMYKNNTVNTFMNEVADELLTKVTWPERKDTVTATFVVIVTVLIASVVLGMLDWLWALALKAVL